MNLLFDLREILYDNKDKEHEMRIIVDFFKVQVELIYNTAETNDEEKMVIPIVYDTCMEFAYIDDKQYRERYHNEDDYGIVKDEAKLIYDIMSYLELHGKEIGEYCQMLGFDCEGNRYEQKIEKCEE